MLGNVCKDLEKCEVDCIFIACNTVHVAYDRIQSYTKIPILHIVDPIGKTCSLNGYDTVGLMGSLYTMEHDFFKGRLEKQYGIHVLIPESPYKEQIHQALYDEITKGNVSDEIHQLYIDCMHHLIERGAKAIILGCTELDLVLHQEDCPVPLLDTTKEHCKEIIEECI